MKYLQNLGIKIFADCTDLQNLEVIASQPWIQGFTTNPTLMRKSGIKQYEEFAQQALVKVGEKPISFEVIADDFQEIEDQAREIASWSPNIYVKIPITNTKGQSAIESIRRLSNENIRLNVTAIFTHQQVEEVVESLNDNVPSIISIFAGRIADTGREPKIYIENAIKKAQTKKKIEVLWASPRELLNLVQADEVGCHIITLTYDLLKKLHLIGKSLEEYSLETVQMFYDDAKTSGYSIASKCKVIL